MYNPNPVLSIFESYYFDQPSAELVASRDWMQGQRGKGKYIAMIEAILLYRIQQP